MKSSGSGWKTGLRIAFATPLFAFAFLPLVASAADPIDIPVNQLSVNSEIILECSEPCCPGAPKLYFFGGWKYTNPPDCAACHGQPGNFEMLEPEPGSDPCTRDE